MNYTVLFEFLTGCALVVLVLLVRVAWVRWKEFLRDFEND